MEDYIFTKYADMLLIYGEILCKGINASRLHEERFPDRRIPAHRLLIERLNWAKCLHNIQVLESTYGR